MALLEEQIERLKSRMRLAVVFGGNKSAPDSVIYRSHNTRSWKSYAARSPGSPPEPTSPGKHYPSDRPIEPVLPGRPAIRQCRPTDIIFGEVAPSA